jgi:periplasmic divalent cation tolerance protein
MKLKKRKICKMGYIIIKTTFENKNDAEKIANKLIEAKLAACIQLSETESYFKWDNKVQNSKEYKLEIKTMSNNYKKVEKFIKENHKYEIPEIIAIKIKKGSKEYLKWMKGELI